MLANKIGGPAGNRLSQWPDIRNRGNLSDEIIPHGMMNSVVCVGPVSYLDQQDHKFSFVDLADEPVVPHPVSP